MTELENYSDVEQLLSLTEELQSENEQYRVEAIQRDRQIQQLSSEKQELVLTVRQQMNKIAEQAEMIERLNGSDLILQENDRLKKQNSDLQRSEQSARREAEATIWSFRSQYAEKEKRLAQTQHEAEETRNEAEALKKRQNELVRAQAEEMYQNTEKRLKTAYKAKEVALKGFFCGSLAYGVLVTVLAAIGSKVFVSDFKSFFATIWNVTVSYFDFTCEAIEKAAEVGNMIQQPIVAAIVYWLVAIVSCILFDAVYLLPLALIVISVICYRFRLKFADNLSLGVFLISLALSVFLADKIRAVVPINLLLLIILVHVVYVLGRWFVKWQKEN